MSVFDEYKKYLSGYYNPKNIDNQEYRPYTYQEWLFKDKPITGGIKV